MPRIVQNRGVARQRSEEEQKAVETILGALAHRFRRLQDEYEMKERRGESRKASPRASRSPSAR
jgi:hypothetical protein